MLMLLAWGASLCVRRCSPHAPPQRVLIIKPDHLGDVLLATPALHLLRQRYPHAVLVALVGPWSAFILRHNPALDAVLTLPFPGFDRHAAPRRSLFAPYRQLFVTAALLRAGHFDTVLLLRDDHWWGAALAMVAGIPCRVGYAVPECRPFLTTALAWHPDQHVTEQGIQLVAALDGEQDNPSLMYGGNEHGMRGVDDVRQMLPLVYTPTAADHAWATTWLQQHRLFPSNSVALPTRLPLVIIHPGTGGATKLWIAERWVAVGQALQRRYAVQVVLTGGPGEESLVEELGQLMNPSPPTMVGEATVGQLTALLGRAALVMGVDSGPLHLAVSQGTPTVHLYGASSVQRYGPWGLQRCHRTLTAPVSCRPCGVFAACPHHTSPPECMMHLDVAQVVAAAAQVLESCFFTA